MRAAGGYDTPRVDAYPGAVTGSGKTTPSPGDRTGRIAAFFDLDKTVIARSSTFVFSKPFFDQGLINRRTVLESSYAHFMFLLSGADHEQMERMRAHLADMCAGWEVAQIQSIVADTLHELVDPLIYAEAVEIGRASCRERV